MAYENSATATLEQKIRYNALDGIRGFALINMIVYHALWDLVYIFGVDMPWYRSFGAHVWQQAICWTFIFLSGFCRSFGSKPLKRGLIVFGAGALVTVATLLFDKNDLVLFGVLTLIGSCMLITVPLDKPLKKCPPLVGFTISMLLFLLTKNVSSGWLGIGSLNILKLPEEWYSNYVTAYFGFPPSEFHSTDYFSLFPWIFYLSREVLCTSFLKPRISFTYFKRAELSRWNGSEDIR